MPSVVRRGRSGRGVVAADTRTGDGGDALRSLWLAIGWGACVWLPTGANGFKKFRGPRRSSDGKGRVDELPAERVARLRDLLFVAGGLEPDALKRVSTTTSSDDSDDEVFVKPRKRRLGR